MEVGSELTILHPPTGRETLSGVQAMVEGIKISITQVEIINIIRNRIRKITFDLFASAEEETSGICKHIYRLQNTDP